MTTFDSCQVITAFDMLAQHMQSIELPPFDTLHATETVLPAFKTLLQQYADQHSRTKKDITILRSAWACIASVASYIPSQSVPESSGSALLPPISSLPCADPVADIGVAFDHSQIDNIRQRITQLEKQLQDLTAEYKAQNQVQGICTENERMRLQVSESADVTSDCHSQAIVSAGGASPPAVLGATDDSSGCHSQLHTCQQLVSRLQKQLQHLTNQNEQLRLKVAESDVAQSGIASPPSPHSTFSKCHASIVSGRHRRNEQFLRDAFNRYKDATGRLCARDLVQALRDVDAPIIPTSEQDISDVIKQFNSNSNQTLDFADFQQACNEPDELQVWFLEQRLPFLADSLRPLVGRCSEQLKALSQLSPSDIQHAASAACSIIPCMMEELHQELRDAFDIQSRIDDVMKADPSKFNDFFKMACGTVADFHKGLTGRVGMPHLNFKNAMRQEHCERAGCNTEFTTRNYKITTTPKSEWQYVVDGVMCPDMGHNRRLISSSELLQRKVSRDANLCEEEVIAVVLYTGPMFQIYNTILRRYPEDKFAIFRDGDNMFSTTIFVLVSAVQKLSRFTRIPLGTLLYRGFGGKMDLPDIFFQTDEQGCCGYAEWGFLSTTSDRDVALGYSGVKEKHYSSKAMVMVIETTSIDRGADISEFSQYPCEKEFLYLPCSFVQPTRQRNGRVQVVDGGLVAIFSVKVNMNIKTQTVEELREQKKSLHMVSARSMLAEVNFELTDWIESADTQDAAVAEFCDCIMRTCKQVVTNHEQMDAKDFADDEIFRRMINEVLDTKEDAGRSRMLFQTAKLRATSVAALEGHCDGVISVQFHPTAALMATGSNDETAKLWVLSPDQMSATCVATLEGHTDRIYSVAFHPSAPLLATGSVDKTAKLWRISPDQTSASFLETLEGHSDGVNCVAFHPKAPLLATGSDDKTAKLWLLSPDHSSATCVATLEGHVNFVNTVAFCPRSPILATSSSDNTAKLWLISPDRSLVTCVATLEGHCEQVCSLDFHPSAPLLATASDDETAKLWLISPDYSATCVATLEGHSSSVNCVAFHPKAPLLATGSDDKTAKLWLISPDHSSATCVATLSKHSSYVNSVAFHPTAPLLATCSSDNTAILYQ